MVAAQNDFAPGKGGDPVQVGQSVLQVHGPGGVAADDDGIVAADKLMPVGCNLGGVVCPVFPEDFHRLGRRLSGKVQVADSVNFHELCSIFAA